MASAESPGTMKYFTRAEVKNHDTTYRTLLIIHNNVYDVQDFLNEHPGGQEVLLEQAGRDATEPFEDVAHSTDARKMMEPFKIGEIIAGERIETDKASKHSYSGNAGDDESSGSWSSWLIPIALGVMATLIYRYFISTH